MHLGLKFPGREVGFDMTFDSSFQSDVNTCAMFDRYGSCEPEVMHVMDRVIGEGDTVVDVGANIGLFTLLMAQMVGPNGSVHAFEPGANNLMKLRANVALNKLANVVVHEMPLWHTEEDVVLHLAADSGLNCLADSVDSLCKIPMRAQRLSNFAFFPAPKLIKIDAEGSEHNILLGARGLFEQVPYIIAEINGPSLERFGSSQRELRDFMALHGYETFLLNTDGFLPVCVPHQTMIVSSQPNLNVLFSKMEHVSRAWPEVELGAIS